MGTDTFDERDLQDAPPPRMIGHQTLFELVAKQSCLMCSLKEYCDRVNDDNMICNILKNIDLWQPLTEKE
jgi:hypothetical protein